MTPTTPDAPSESSRRGSLTDRVVLIECNIDDMTGEALAYALDRLLAEGALDAWFCPLQMKKGRPGILLSVLCTEERAEHLRGVLLRETTTLGVRWRLMERQIAARRTRTVATPYGTVRVKIKILDGQAFSAKPEYEDCAALALRAGVPLVVVQQAAAEAAGRMVAGDTSDDA